MPWSDAGITETSDPQVFLQTICNLPLSLDKVPTWGAFSVFRDSMSSSEARICWWASGQGGKQLTRSWFYPQQVTQNPLIRLILHSCQLTSNSGCTTAFLHWGFLWWWHRFGLCPEHNCIIGAVPLKGKVCKMCGHDVRGKVEALNAITLPTPRRDEIWCNSYLHFGTCMHEYPAVRRQLLSEHSFMEFASQPDLSQLMKTETSGEFSSVSRQNLCWFGNVQWLDGC